MFHLERPRSNFCKNLLGSVDTEWDRISAGKGAAEYLLPARTRPDLHYGATEVQTGYLSALCWCGSCCRLPNICSWRPCSLEVTPGASGQSAFAVIKASDVMVTITAMS